MNFLEGCNYSNEDDELLIDIFQPSDSDIEDPFLGNAGNTLSIMKDVMQDDVVRRSMSNNNWINDTLQGDIENTNYNSFVDMCNIIEERKKAGTPHADSDS